jgi:hypothetical protein
LAHHPAVNDLADDDNLVAGAELELVRTTEVITRGANDLLTL